MMKMLQNPTASMRREQNNNKSFSLTERKEIKEEGKEIKEGVDVASKEMLESDL